MRELLRRWRAFFERGRYERELEEEMAHHVSMLQASQGENGNLESPDACLFAARKQFGNVTLWKEDVRSMWSFAFFEQTAQDIRYALRAMAANPLFTITAAISLALGIGANTAIYSFMDAILLRALPVAQPEQLAIVRWHANRRPKVVRSINGTAERYHKTGTLSPNFPYAALDLFRGDRQLFSTVFGYTYTRNFNVIASGEAESVAGGFVSGNYFAGLGVPPAAGRLIAEADDAAGAPALTVLAYDYWRRRYHNDSAAIGKSISINNLPFTIIGVAAPGFFGVDPQANPAFFLPMHAMPTLADNPALEARERFLDEHRYWLEMMMRLRPGVTMRQAETALRGQFAGYAAGTAESPGDLVVLPEVELEEGRGGIDSLRRQYSQPLIVLMTMVGLILAIACANLANLLLARSAARRREIAVRLSLGAGRWRIVRQMLTESVLLSMVGGALGLLVALAGIRLITWLIANGRADFTLHAELNWPVLGFTFALAVFAGMVFGLAPALQATKLDYTPALKESRNQGAAVAGGRFRPRLTHLLIVTQIAVSLLLVAGAGLFVRTLANLHSIDVGFNRENLLLVNINGAQGGFKDAELARFYAGLLEKFRRIPGVRAASASDLPLVAYYMNDENISIPGRTPRAGDPSVEFLHIDPRFLDTMQIPVLLGRGLEDADLASPAVAVVNQKFAATFFGNESPVGRQFSSGKNSTGPLVEIVGVVRNAHYNSLQESEQPVVYFPYTHKGKNLGGMYFELRTAGDPFGAVSGVRTIVHDASRSVSITRVSTQAQMIEQTISRERTFADLGTCFAILALAIACVGLYGAMAYMVARRTGEIGIRMALGAQRPKIVWMVMREVLALTAVGVLAGLAAAHYVTRLVESFLYGVKPNDPLAAAGAIATLLAAAMAAGYAPAWRASRIDPAVSLRNE